MKPAFRVSIDMTAPETHRARVTIRAAADELHPVLQFPVWTPGSYLVREYARHVTRLEPAEKIAKNQWRLKGKPSSISYEVYCFERTVRSSFLDTTHAALVGATLLPLLHEPFEVELLLPKNWSGVSSALKFQKLGGGRWRAFVKNDDDWIDKPIVAWAPGYGNSGKIRVHGITHHIAWVGQNPSRSMKDLQEMFAKVARTTLGMFGGAPFREYWCLLHFGQKLYGGLEHRDSQLSQFDGATLHETAEWKRFIHLIAHEYFHSWNVKSLRPLALGPFDYGNENYTQDIWFAEGLTDYFDDLIPLRAGLYEQKDLNKYRLKDISTFSDGHPGQQRRSLAESSFDAWIRYYRPDEDSVNTDVSYYSKGSTLGWCWDAHLQKRSRKKWNLAKLMREFWKEFGIDAYEPLKDAKPGFTREQLLKFAEKKTGVPQRTLVEGWVTGRKPLPWRNAARFFKVKWKEDVTALGAEFLGLNNKWENGKGTITSVLSGGAAERAGAAAQDEIIGINGIRVNDAEKFKLALKNAMRTGKEVELCLARLDQLIIRKVRWRKHNSPGVELQPV